MAETIFWLCLSLPLFACLGYPLLLACCAPFQRPPPSGAPTPPPRVSVIVAAHDEERHIGAKLRSLLDDDYPRERRQIIVASDGSRDATVALARHIAQGNPWDDIRVLDLPRGGKAAALNAAVALAYGEILVFSDADTLWHGDTLRQLIAPFADPRVGASAGNVTIPDGGRALAIGDRVYRAYETWLRRLESRNGCLASADGGLQALRRELFQPVPDDVTDDFFLVTCAPLAGRRIVFAEAARVTDRGVESAQGQFRRRRRITVQGLQSLARRRELLDPARHGLFALALITHKLLRRFAPLLLVPLLASNLWLWGAGGFYRFALLAQLAGYGLALIGLLGRHRRLPRPFRLAACALVTLGAMGVGVWQFLGGYRYRQWNPQQSR
ncbi:glycosyltransferase [Azotobacter vinelandii]|uniref:glycosyltransferase n=1 Tax=Azotobacter vinelandii TaxID=354 RepID=UPI000774006D|nr:glycosyltransferase [Azotobacter vinelandii]WKN22546.1 glycosyltransferase [Azotobacter vinelandii]